MYEFFLDSKFYFIAISPFAGTTLLIAVLKSLSVSPSNLVFFKIVLAILGLLQFHINASIRLSISVEKPVGMSVGIALKV